MSTPEGLVKAKVRKALKLRRIYYEQNTAGAMGTAGVPDIRCCRPVDGHFGGIETKAGTWIVSDLQRIKLQELEESMGSAMVVNEANIDLAVKWMDTPGWRVVARFDAKVKNKCTHHIAMRMDGSGATEIKNPPVTRTKRATP